VGHVIGHAAVLRELRTIAAAPEPAHALLFTGPEATGRTLLAREYARLLNCELRAAAPSADEPGVPCGECRACRLIAEGAHPDVVAVTPGDSLCRPRQGDSSHPPHADSRDIRVCQSRGVVELASRYPFEARYRLVIVEPAERLHPDAANMLLKTLEEPPAHTLFALVTAAPESVLETVRSRCRRLDIRPVARSEIEAALLERGVEAAHAAHAASASRGRPALALRYAAHPDAIADRERVLQRFARLAAAGVVERFRYSDEVRDRWERDRMGVHADLDAWDVFWEEHLIAAAAKSPAAAAGALAALRAVARAREDLLANCQRRPAVDLMLLTFPRLTLAPSTADTPPPDA
jgi:DNA polymerase-3 subunit delta'